MASAALLVSVFILSMFGTTGIELNLSISPFTNPMSLSFTHSAIPIMPLPRFAISDAPSDKNPLPSSMASCGIAFSSATKALPSPIIKSPARLPIHLVIAHKSPGVALSIAGMTLLTSTPTIVPVSSISFVGSSRRTGPTHSTKALPSFLTFSSSRGNAVLAIKSPNF